MSVSSLPPELLVIIFEECVQLAHSQDGLCWPLHICEPRCLLDWVQITHVCHDWRLVALGEPRLWARPVMKCRRWAEEMLIRSGSRRLSIAANVEENDYGRLTSTLERANDLVVQAPLDSLISLLEELNALMVPPREDVKLNSLSLARAPGGDAWSNRDPTANFSLVNASEVKRLHISHLLFGLRPSNFFSAMSNLRELTLICCLASMIDSSSSQIHLPSLVRLHLVDPISYCKTFLALLDHSNALEYFGVDNGDEWFRPLTFLQTTLQMLSQHHILGRTDSPIPLDLSACNCALSITTRHSALSRPGNTHFGFAAWPNTVISASELVSSISAGLSLGSRFFAPLTPAEFSAVFTSNPTLFVRGACRNNFRNLLEALPQSFSLRPVVCAVVNDSTELDEDITQHVSHEAAFLSEMPSLQYLRLNHLRLVSVINRLRPADGYDSAILVPILSELALVVTDVHKEWVAPLAACIRARSARGCDLKKLSIQGNPQMTEDERKTLEKLPLIIDWGNIPEL